MTDERLNGLALLFAYPDITLDYDAVIAEFGKSNRRLQFLSRVSILTRDIDIANLPVRPSVCPSVRYIPVLYENGLTYCHSFCTIR